MVEDAKLTAIAEQFTETMAKGGWRCILVAPRIDQKLYNRILGIGNTPIHPGGRNMRWCTRSTKIDPMEQWRKANRGGLTLTGRRIGESKMRDGKIAKHTGCQAGGECGIPPATDSTYDPIINWRTCNVVDWLNGLVDRNTRRTLSDLRPLTKELLDIYDVRVNTAVFDFSEPKIDAARFGCIGCPAICSERAPPKSVVARNGFDSPLNELYDVWFEARRRDNRLVRYKAGKDGRGPIKMAVRRVLFDRVIDIQQRAGVVLVTPEDEAFIKQCWANKVYPRGWSEADESVTAPDSQPLFQTL